MRLSSIISSKFLMLLMCGLLLGGTAWATTVVNFDDYGIGGSLLPSNGAQPDAFIKVYDRDLSTGSGEIHSIVRLHSNDTFEEGFNTDYRPPQHNENPSPTFTRDLDLNMVPWFNTIGDEDDIYLEFRQHLNHQE